MRSSRPETPLGEPRAPGPRRPPPATAASPPEISEPVHEHPWGLLSALLCSAALVWLFQPRWLVSPGTPAGFDLSGHFYPFRLAYDLLSHGRIHGWSNGWFAGFPLFYFYFPLPAFLASALAVPIGFAAGFKVMSVLGIVAYPLAVAWLLSELRLRQTVVAIATLASCGLLFTGYPDLGANVASTLGGEFSYSIAFTLSLAYLAAVLRAQRRPDRRAPLILASGLLAATALSHTIAAAAVVLGVAPLLADVHGRKVVLFSWVAGFLLSAFWALPFLTRAGLMFAPFTGNAPLRRAFIPEVVLALPIALAGTLLLRRSRRAWILAWLGLLCLAAAAVPQHVILSLRFLPYWYATVFLFAGIAAGLLGERALRLRSPAAILGACILTLLPLVGAARYPMLRGWAGWAFAGLEQKPAWPVVEGLITALRQAPPGRIHWEDDERTFARTGSRNIFTLLPYWAPGHDALGGLWVESSPTAALVGRINREIARAGQPGAGPGLWSPIARELGALGVRYFVTVRPGSAAPFAEVAGVRALWGSAPLELFEIPAAPLVQTPPGESGASSILVSADEIRFHTAALGIPHRVLVSFFPNWEADGATGPVRDGTFMSVVPTRRDVRLRFRAGALELLGMLLTALGVAVVTWTGLRFFRASASLRSRSRG